AIAWDQAEQRVGQQATVQGPVVGTHFAEESRGQPTFLNIGNPFPDPNRLTVVIWIEDRAAFPEPPETAYDGKTVCVTGVIETYEGVPEIVAASPSVIAIVEAR
ncbi:MAG: DNA-binding protein, partial [Dehalococcoidia bacterium]|nr:DNA-binding protein [Dehalococcoidia bacterium]